MFDFEAGNDKLLDMNKKIFIIIFALLAVGGGYWLLSGGDNEVLKPTDNLALNSTVDSSAAATSTSTQTATQGNSQKIINNVNDDKKNMNAILRTNKGDITIELDSVNAPNTAANFVKLAKSGFYDGTKFHRVIKGFMNQGGDPLSKDDSMIARWGTGGPGYSFADEIGAKNSNDIGTIAMANSGPNTNGSQFFINAQANHYLNPKHTVFGRVTSGMDVIMLINSAPTDGSDRPINSVIIKGIDLK